MDRERLYRARRMGRAIVLIAAAGLALAACSVAGNREAGNPLPTPRPTENVGAEARSEAKETPEETWEGYLRDMIAYQANQFEARLAMYQRYENPDHTAQNAGGLMKEIALLEDRTEWSGNERAASALVDFDVRVTLLDGDTETRHCSFTVEQQYDEEDGVWYVIAPKGLDVTALCSR